MGDMFLSYCLIPPTLSSEQKCSLTFRNISYCMVPFASGSVEAPEEEYDPRSLFAKLEEQKLKKQDEYESQFKMSEFE